MTTCFLESPNSTVFFYEVVVKYCNDITILTRYIQHVRCNKHGVMFFCSRPGFDSLDRCVSIVGKGLSLVIIGTKEQIMIVLNHRTALGCYER